MRLPSASLISAMLLGGCASAGGTAGVFDSVKECGGGAYPGVQIRRYNCGKRYLAEGYVEVQKCKEVPPGTLCVTDAERYAAEAAGKGQPSSVRAWVLWRPVLDSGGQPLPDQWAPLRGFDSRQDCEAEQRRISTQSVLCLPDTVDPRGPKVAPR
jgi:hypothetical protein